MTLKTLSRAAAALVLGLLILTAPVYGQTATTNTTLSSAVADSAATSFLLASATDVEAGSVLFLDREAVDVISVSSTTARVRRGMYGTRATPHVTASVVYVASRAQKPFVFKSNQARGGTCTRANEAYLPQVDLPSGILWDCPVGATLWAPLNFDLNTVRSQAFNLDNGAGTTVDALLIRHPRPLQFVTCRIVYQDATTGTVAGGNAKVGTTVGGAQIVAATAYADATAVGTTTAMVIVDGKVAAATPVLVRHTGVAATQAGEAVVECDYVIR